MKKYQNFSINKKIIDFLYNSIKIKRKMQEILQIFFKEKCLYLKNYFTLNLKNIYNEYKKYTVKQNVLKDSRVVFCSSFL